MLPPAGSVNCLGVEGSVVKDGKSKCAVVTQPQALACMVRMVIANICHVIGLYVRFWGFWLGGGHC